MHSHFEQDIIIEKHNRQCKAWGKTLKRGLILEIRSFKSTMVDGGM